MELKRFDNLIAIRTSSGNVIGFHSRNLQVATLDPAIWTALKELAKAPLEVREEIQLWNQEIDTKVTDAKVEQATRSLSINVAQVCNLKCGYCAAGGDGTYGSKAALINLEKIYSQLNFLLQQVPNGERFTITFLGGEPLVYPEAIEAINRHVRLLTAGREIDLVYEITTNATMITPDVADLLARMRSHVTVSLDGPPEVNDRNRPTKRGAGSTMRTLDGISELMNVKSRLGSLGVNSVFGQHNCDVIGTYRFLKEFDWDVINLSYAAGEGDEVYSPLYTEQLCQIADLAFAEGGERELRRISQFDHYFRILDGQQRIHNYCGAGKSLLQVDTEGRFYTCNWFVNDSDEEVGRDLHLDQERLQEYAAPLIELNNCQTCWARYICGGGCMFVHKTKTGDKHKVDKDFCIRTRSLITKGIEHYEKARVHEEKSGGGREVH